MSDVKDRMEGLKALTSGAREPIARRLKAWGYRVEWVPIPQPLYQRWALEDVFEEQARLYHAGALPGDPSFQILVVVLSRAPVEGVVSWQARWAGRLWRRNRTFRGILMTVCPSQGQTLVSVPFPRGHVDKPGLHHVVVRGAGVCAADRERLRRLRVTVLDCDAETITTRLREELDLKHLTRAFFKALRRVHKAMTDGVTGTGLTQAERADQALLTLNRLLFLYFVQRKGLMDGRQDFLRQEVRRARMRGGKIYRRLLKPLFFELLNTPVAERTDDALTLGEIPYLNGGLFEPSSLEQRRPLMEIKDDALNLAFDTLLERYAFVTQEDGHGLGVDPEVLGRAFESLMSQVERGTTGTFYTPRPLVESLVGEGLRHLLVRIGASSAVARRLVEDGEAASGPLPAPAHARDLLGRLEDVAVLDPACGSGAFLLGAMRALEVVHRRLRCAARLPAEEGSTMRRRLVQRNLHGVDLNPTAVRLCELRLWLAILDATPVGEPIEPLPNLDCRVRQGDALLEPVDWSDTPNLLHHHRAQIRELEALKHDYARANASQRALLSHDLRDAETHLFKSLTQQRRATHARECAELKAAEASALIPVGPRTRLRRAWLALEEELDHLDTLIYKLDEHEARPGFSPTIHFPEIMSRGGFDWILTNPPWVRLHSVPPPARRRLRARYKTLRDGAWTAGGKLKHLKGAGSQVDLSACFVERALELLAPGGVLSALLPSKLFRALYGGGLRRLLMTQAPPLWLHELGEGAFPEATTYPLALVARRTPPRRHATVQLGARGVDATPLSLRALRLEPDDLASPWLMAPPDGGCAGLDLTTLRGVRVGEHPAISLRRGVMTGFNEAFIDRGALLPEVRRALRPLLRGGDVGAWRARPSSALLWTHDDEVAAPLVEPPAALLEALEGHIESLQSRTGLHSHEGWWRIFRTGPHLFGPKVVWRDIGRRLEAAAVPATTSMEGEERAMIPLNTVYFMPVACESQALVLAAWLNSAPVRRFANALAERAAGGHRRFFAWVISLLPLPDMMARALRDRRSWERAMNQESIIEALWLHSRALHQSGADPDRERAIDGLVESLYVQSVPSPRLLDVRCGL